MVLHRKLSFVALCSLTVIAAVVVLRLTKPAPEETVPVLPTPTTWHFTGWKSVGGKRLPWELWGRTSPYFAYEKLGEGIRVWHEASGALYIPPVGAYVATLVQGIPTVGADRANPPYLRYQSWKTSDRDPQNGLPTHFVLKTTPRSEPNGELTATYNLPLPPDIEAPLSRPGTVVLDVKDASRSGSKPSQISEVPIGSSRTQRRVDFGPLRSVQVQVIRDRQSFQQLRYLLVQARPRVSTPTEKLPIEARLSVLGFNAAMTADKTVRACYGTENQTVVGTTALLTAIQDPARTGAKPSPDLDVLFYLELRLKPEVRSLFRESVVAIGQRRELLPQPQPGTYPPAPKPLMRRLLVPVLVQLTGSTDRATVLEAYRRWIALQQEELSTTTGSERAQREISLKETQERYQLTLQNKIVPSRRPALAAPATSISVK